MMPERGKVIAEIHYCTKGSADPGEDECNPSKCRYAVYQNSYDYDCKELLLKDAFALLKEQEARVLSWEEVKKSGSAYRCVELYSPQVQRLALIYCNVRQSETIPEFYYLLEDSGVRWCRSEAEYNRGEWWGAFSGWRCWTARPTDGQRKAVKWDE